MRGCFGMARFGFEGGGQVCCRVLHPNGCFVDSGVSLNKGTSLVENSLVTPINSML